MHTNAIDDLRTFNRAVAQLAQSRFAEHMRTSGTGYALKKLPDGGWSFRDLGPDREAIADAVLTIRQFLLTKDRISFASLARTYEALPVDEETRCIVRDHHAELEKHLNSAVPIRFRDGVLTYRRLIDVFLYGGLVHSDREKTVVFQAWAKHRVMFELFREAFLHTCSDIVNAAASLRETNERTIELLERLQASGSAAAT